MKTNKLVKMISALSILSFAILGGVSCNNGNSDPDGNKTDEVTEIVLFDPEKSDYELKDIGGEKYAVITVDEYKTVIKTDKADCSKMTKFTAKFCAAEAKKNFNVTIGIKDKGVGDDGKEKFNDISNPVWYEVGDVPTEKEAGFAEKTDWNTVSETKIVEVIQPMVQDSSAGYAAQSGVVIYLGKVIAKK